MFSARNLSVLTLWGLGDTAGCHQFCEGPMIGLGILSWVSVYMWTKAMITLVHMDVEFPETHPSSHQDTW